MFICIGIYFLSRCLQMLYFCNRESNRVSGSFRSTVFCAGRKFLLTAKATATRIAVPCQRFAFDEGSENPSPACKQKNRGIKPRFFCLAQREGFEPSVDFHQHSISSAAPSTSRTSLRAMILYNISSVFANDINKKVDAALILMLFFVFADKIRV